MTFKPLNVRKSLARAFAAALAAAVLAPTAAQAYIDDGLAPTRPYKDWFRVREAVAEDWSVSGFDARPNEVLITPRARAKMSSQRDPFHVMVLYPKPSSAYDTAISKILTMFHQRGVNAQFTAINMARDEDVGRAAIEFAEKDGVNLIFGMGSESTAWLWKNYRDGAIPVVSVTSKDPVMLGQAEDYETGSKTNFAFTSLNMPVSAQLAYVNQLRPGLKNLAVLVDRTNVSAVETQARPILEMAKKRGVRTLNLEVQSPETARKELAELVADAVQTMRLNDVTLENSLFWVTGSTSVFREIATINAHADRVPVLSVVPEVVREGDDSAALSIGISFGSNAHLASIYGMQVLLGEAKVGELPVGIVSPPDIAINFKRARHIGLDIPFNFVEGASFIYDYNGKPVRRAGINQK